MQVIKKITITQQEPGTADIEYNKFDIFQNFLQNLKIPFLILFPSLLNKDGPQAMFDSGLNS